ncbi:hypothetical protein SEUCBS140593_004036 [Sporothrix eucalyptigena]|uniref:LITAF domain-containing protein n=1 Tax=Sporothrix eucalyptigena TaxID=1812306 RepID=A0ABP0BJR1_9PEZI
MPSDFDVIQDMAWFCQRLAQANTRRREQLKYWKRRPYETISMTNMVLPASKPEYEDRSGKPDMQKQKPTTTLNYRSSTTRQTISTATQTISTARSFSTVAFSDVHNTKTVERARTTYAPTAAGQDHVNTIPDPPNTGGAATFFCPYCGMELDKDEMQNRQAWK